MASNLSFVLDVKTFSKDSEYFFLDSLTLEDGTDVLYRNVGN